MEQTCAQPQPPLPVGPAAAARRYDIDWLRVLAMLTVFFFHTARFFDPIDWHVKDAHQSAAALVFVGFCSGWLMPLLMLLAGAGSWFALQRRTAGQYLRERVARLLVPLYTVGLFILIPPQCYWDRVAHGQYSGSFWEFYPRFFRTFNLHANLGFLAFWSGHLWFLRWLFLFSLLSLPLLLSLRSNLGRRLIARLAAWGERPGGAFLFVIPIAVAEVGLKRLWPGDFGGGHAAYLLVFFLLGYVLVADERFTATIRRHGRACGWLGGAAFGALAWIVFGLHYEPWKGASPAALGVVFSLLSSLSSWCWVVLFLALGNRYLNTNSRLLAYANEAVLPFYVLHQTIILAVGRYVVSINVGIGIKYVVIAAASFVLIMVLYEFPVRRIGIFRLLFGMRRRAPRSAISTGQAARGR